MKFFIIYEITNNINNKKYIGCHITKNIHDDYMGSGKYLKNAIKKYGIENFSKKIIHYCKNEEDMIEKEKEIVNEKIVNSENYYNLTIGGNSFYHINSNIDINSVDKVIVKDKDGKIYKINKNDNRYKNGELISVIKDKVICKDINNNFYWINKNDSRYNNTLYPVNKGLILVKNDDGKILMMDKNDIRYKNGEFKPFWVNKKHTNETKIKIGIKNSEKQKGIKNSQYGTCWIINEKEYKCKKIKKDEFKYYESLGWIKGRKMNW